MLQISTLHFSQNHGDCQSKAQDFTPNYLGQKTDLPTLKKADFRVKHTKFSIIQHSTVGNQKFNNLQIGVVGILKHAPRLCGVSTLPLLCFQKELRRCFGNHKISDGLYRGSHRHNNPVSEFPIHTDSTTNTIMCMCTSSAGLQCDPQMTPM